MTAPLPILELEPEAWRADARCADAGAAIAGLFFSEQLDDIAAAKVFCRGCAVQSECLDGALRRREPIGVWGGELFANGHVIPQKRPRGRPRKVNPDSLAAAEARLAEARIA
ncbi:MAG: WhiB family transcriptional regulator [Acidimicrobiia bacterium]